MNRAIQFALFFSIFLAIFLSIHIYSALRVAGLLGYKNRWLILWILLASIIFPAASIAVHYSSNIFARLFYTVGSVWAGFIWILFSIVLMFELVNLIHKFDPRIAGFAILSAAVLLSVFAVLSASFVRVKDVEIPIVGLENELTAVQLSDLHVGTVRNSGFLQSMIGKANSLEPDMVFVTGDLVDGSGFYKHKSYDIFKQVDAPTYFVTGNHEVYAGGDEIVKMLESSGMTILRNRAVMDHGLQIIGVDDPGNDQHISLDTIDFDKDKPTVLLRHQPALAEEAQAKGVDLMISGHTHNGQVFPFDLLVRLQWKYKHGLYRIGNMFLYVSPGTGTWGPPMRLGSFSEITHFKLVPA